MPVRAREWTLPGSRVLAADEARTDQVSLSPMPRVLARESGWRETCAEVMGRPTRTRKPSASQGMPGAARIPRGLGGPSVTPRGASPADTWVSLPWGLAAAAEESDTGNGGAVGPQRGLGKREMEQHIRRKMKMIWVQGKGGAGERGMVLKGSWAFAGQVPTCCWPTSPRGSAVLCQGGPISTSLNLLLFCTGLSGACVSHPPLGETRRTEGH